MRAPLGPGTCRRGTCRRLPLLAALVLVQGAPLAAQAPSARAQAWPEGWVARPDDPAADLATLAFTDMPPGWHLTTGPAVILYRPADAPGGRFRIEMEVYLFDPGTRREAFGFFTGGRDLEGDAQRYTYYLIREGGEYLVKKRRGAATEIVAPWTPHPAIRSFADVAEGEATVKNVLVLEADDRRVRLLVNGEEVVALPRAAVDVDGMVGLRVNHALNLHVSRLSVTPER